MFKWLLRNSMNRSNIEGGKTKTKKINRELRDSAIRVKIFRWSYGMNICSPSKFVC